MDGKIIVIDGMDGCGKNTQANLLYNRLKAEGVKVKLFSFPNYYSDSSYFVKKLLKKDYDDIKNNTYLISLFYSIDRGITYLREIKELYDNGYTIIMDRYIISNVLYQIPESYYEKMLYINFLKTVEVSGIGLPIPDITIILKSEPEVSSILLNKRYGDEDKKDIYETLDVQNKIYENINFIEKYKDLISVKSSLGKIEIIQIQTR